ncbi:protein BatD [Rhizobium sp. P32RR-XVIII]|uniref:BatD family protein n=1 Tax=Rhizobium sp. P32RR-XVIII TaxID=2726738 RepID=UPI0014576FCE|nr:BatD family protein [Rhizobium sp. P32RR-XVIII]NLS03552.1 protein BatD [Rhizobium sp. P32RR-XVIII]
MRLTFLLFLLLTPLQALAAEPFAQATVDDGGDIVPGRQVYVTVDVFAPDFFTSPPQFPLFDLPNALVTLPDERAQNLLQTVDGVQYSGIRRRYAVVPQMPGRYVVPPIEMELGYSADGKPARGVVTAPSVSFVVQGSPGMQERVAFAARKLTIGQTFDRDPASLKAGDALVRTITITAEDTQAMMIPAVRGGTVAGLHEYVKQPKIEDGIAIGRAMASRRTETVVYTADAVGTYTLPEIDYDWFDVDSHREDTASLPAVPVTVAPAPIRQTIAPDAGAQDDGRPAHVDRQRLAIGMLSLLAAAALVWLGRRLAPLLVERVRRLRQRYRASHAFRLRQLKKTIGSADEMAVYAGLQEWSRDQGYRSLEDWANDGPRDLRLQVDLLSRSLFRSDDSKVDRHVLQKSIDFRRAVSVMNSELLPPLNPSGQQR